jgi:hypothetical protein
MSGLVVGMVLKYSRSRGITRLTLVSIADCCRDDGTGAWPAIPTIAKRAGTSVRTAQRCIKKAEQLGELAVDENAGPHRTNLYEIKIDRLLANRDGDKSSPSKNSVKLTGYVRTGARRCQDVRRDGDKAMSSDPSLPLKIRPKEEVDKSTSIRNATGIRECTHLKCGPEGCGYPGGSADRHAQLPKAMRELCDTVLGAVKENAD